MQHAQVRSWDHLPSIAAHGRHWPAVLASNFVELDFEPLGRRREPVRSLLQRQAFGELTFVRASTHGDAHRVTRSERLLRASAHDNYFIGYVMDGMASLAQRWTQRGACTR